MLKLTLARNLVVTLALVLAAHAPAGAVFFYVDTTAVDLGDLIPGDGKCEWATIVPLGQRCSLRAAVDEANAWPGEDVIIIPAGIRYEMTIADDLDIFEDVLIGSFLATPDDRPVLDVNGLHRMFQVHPGAKLTLEKVIITGGRRDDLEGGAIRVSGSSANLTLRGSALVGNSAFEGSALYVWSQGPTPPSTLEIIDTDIRDNFSTHPTTGTAVAIFSRPVTIVRSTIAGNSHPQAALFLHDASASIANSTIANNSGNGVKVKTQLVVPDLDLDNVTIYGNSGTGLDVEGTLTAWNSIIADNGLDCDLVDFLSQTFAKHNLDSDDSCFLDALSGDLPNTDPQLGPLLDNGGWTPTLVPKAGSPVIDRGFPGACLAEDQRGAPRAAGEECEIGAVELLPCVGTPHLVVSGGFISIPFTYVACYTITAGPALDIVAGGDVTFRTRHTVVFTNGFSVQAGGRLSVIRDPTSGSGITLP